MQTQTAQPAVTAAELASFQRDGYLVKKGLIPAEWMARIDAETAGLHEAMAQAVPDGVGVTWDKAVEGKPRKIRQLMNSEKVCPTLDQARLSDYVLDVVEALIGPNISHFHSKLLMKAAHDGTITPWHQDFGYWHKGESRPEQINCMLAIDPATKANGCIQFVPGSHANGLLTHEEKNTGYGFSIYLPGYFEPNAHAVAIESDPGDCVFFGPLVIHGSDKNNSPHSRRANTMAYCVTNEKTRKAGHVLRGA